MNKKNKKTVLVTALILVLTVILLSATITASLFASDDAAESLADESSETKVYRLNVTAGENGGTFPSGETLIGYGEDKTLYFVPEEGYRVADVTIDGESKGRVAHYMLKNVSSNHMVSVSFEKIGFEKMVDLTYTFDGDEKDKAGFAQGRITVTPVSETKAGGYYLVYFADENGLLEEYDELACIEKTGEAVAYEVKDGSFLPANVTKLAVFESESRFLDKHPVIEDAVDVINVTHTKRLELGELRYTFGATSDVHMNFEALGFGSLAKWEGALEFFADSKVDSVIVTGDMTGDDELEEEYKEYVDRIDASAIPLECVYEAIGNHGNTLNAYETFAKYTGGSDEVHPYEGSPYYYVLKSAEQGRDNLFIFMAQELKAPGDSAEYDNFSKRQVDWLERVLNEFENSNTNIFLIEHSPILNWSPGDRLNGDYTRMITFKESYTQTMRLKALLEKHKRVIMMTGHTHLTFYENENYSDQYDSFCRMVHVSSGTQTSSYNHGNTLISDTDGRKLNSPIYGSEGYIVSIYDDYIIYTGYNISTRRIIPAACIILPTVPYGGSGGEVIDPTVKDVTGVKRFLDLARGSGTAEDPYLISSETEFKLLTDEFSRSVASDEKNMFGYGKYFLQMCDLDMRGVEGYNGTAASGSTRYTFAGNYNGNGHTIRVDISGGGQQSVFPYSYGVISNLKVEGSIKGGTCAQVVRALHGKLINCIFDVDLDAEQEAGAIYSNYGYVYNLYLIGEHSSDSDASVVSVNHNSTRYYNVFCNRTQNNRIVSSPYGTLSEDIESVVAAFNDRNGKEYEVALGYLGGYAMCVLAEKDGTADLAN